MFFTMYNNKIEILNKIKRKRNNLKLDIIINPILISFPGDRIQFPFCFHSV